MTEAGLLMSYGPNLADMFRQVGVYTATFSRRDDHQANLG
jgi:hypothetical protein